MMRAGVCALALWALALVPGIAAAQVAMPDPSLIHGKAIPAAELPAGTVTVRVVREALGNNLPGQQVRVTAGSVSRAGRTDDQGRAEFADLPKGSQATAEVVVDGETLTSDAFTVPSSGGLRVILVAGLGRVAAQRKAEEARALAEPPAKGIVVLGSNSRILMEFQDDSLQVFYLFEILNNARTRVDIGGPLVIDLPTGAAGASTLEGSSKQVTIAGDRVTVTGPFAPGVTAVQLGYTLRYESASFTLRQVMPAALEQVTVALQKVGGATMRSSQFSTTSNVASDNGTPFLLGSGKGLPAGAALTVDLEGLPAHSLVPRYTAVTLATLVLCWGAWMAFSGRGDDADARRRLVARRDTLLGDLAQLEQRRRSGQESPKDAARRLRVAAELEQIYGELDATGNGPQGGDEGVAA